MKTAVVTLAYGEHLRGAELLFHTLRGAGLPDSIDRIVLSPEPMSIDFAESRVVTGYDPAAGVPLSRSPGLDQSPKKLAALTLDYDRIIGIDSDVFCVGDFSLLWSDTLSRLPFYAVRDYGAVDNHGSAVAALRLNPDLIFNAGVYVYNRPLLPNLHDAIMADAAAGTLRSYDTGDQGYLNGYFQTAAIEVGFLPPEYNYMLASTFPQLPPDQVRLVHFVGPLGKPWQVGCDIADFRARWHHLWWRKWAEYLEAKRT